MFVFVLERFHEMHYFTPIFAPVYHSFAVGVGYFFSNVFVRIGARFSESQDVYLRHISPIFSAHNSGVSLLVLAKHSSRRVFDKIQLCFARLGCDFFTTLM